MGVERILPALLDRVDDPVWCREKQEAVGREKPQHLADEPIMVVDVLERLETGDEVEGPVLELGQLEHVALDETEVGTAVVRLGMFHGGPVDVDGHDLVGLVGQKRCPVTLACGEVEHTPAGSECGSEEVSVVVLVDHR